MSTVTSAALVAAPIVLSIVALSFVLRAITRGVAARGRVLIAANHTPVTIVIADEMANNLGIQSKGRWQLRGNGALVLTRDALHFHPMAGAAPVRVPLGHITAVTRARAHLGKTIGRALLKIAWTEHDHEEMVAFFVRDLEAWERSLADLRAAPPGPSR